MADEGKCLYCRKWVCECDPNDARIREQFWSLLPVVTERIRTEGLPLRLEPREVHIIDQMSAISPKREEPSNG